MNLYELPFLDGHGDDDEIITSLMTTAINRKWLILPYEPQFPYSHFYSSCFAYIQKVGNFQFHCDVPYNIILFVSKLGEMVVGTSQNRNNGFMV